MTRSETIFAYLPAVIIFGGWLLAVVVLIFRRRWVWATALGCSWLLALGNSLASWKPAWPESKKRACISNMQWIQEKKVAWASENKKPSSDEPTKPELEKYFKDGIPHCPIDDRHYRLRKVAELPVCPNAKQRGHILESQSGR